jgi:enoyl-CoA hydratase
MSDPLLLQDGDIVVRAQRGLRRITLNRPQALNAITLDMAVAMTGFMRAWAEDPAVAVVLLDGAGGRAFAAGGDIRALYDAAKAGGALPAQFWATEYRLNVRIARYPKPVVAIMDGLVMGGGVGLSAYASHRVVTERSAVAMPEVGIGYFPDVGVSFPLARAPGQVGTHVALTGERLNGADAIYCGLADIHVPAAAINNIAAALADCRSAEEVDAQLDRLAAPPSPGRLTVARPWIDCCYRADDIETIIDRLQHDEAGDAAKARDAIRKASPTSLKITLRNIRAALSFQKLEQSFAQDYRLSLNCVAGHDFMEGIRAAIVDKDRNPSWRPAKIEDVTPEIVDRHFRSLGAMELKLED